MMIRKASFIIASFLLLLTCGCNSQAAPPTSSPTIRLAKDYNTDWAQAAIGSLNIDVPIKSVTIAVLDTGCLLQTDTILRGYNAINQTNDVADQNQHGDLVIQKIIELNSSVKIIPIKITDNWSNIDPDLLAKGISKAIELKADIINLSLGTEKNYDIIRKAIQDAIQHNILVVASSGNNGKDLMYPAKYDHVISVMARDINNKEPPFNSKSLQKLSFSAPGEHILIGSYYYNGTSIAAAYLSAAAAYILQKSPSASIQIVQEILEKACHYPSSYSYGIIDYRLLNKKFN